MKPMHVHRLAWLGYHEGEWESCGKNSIYLWEPLDAKEAPHDAKVFCHGLGEITFYDRTGNGIKEQNVRHTQLDGDTALCVGGVWHQIASGRAMYRKGIGWCMRWLAYRNTRLARMLNAGWTEYRS